MDSTASLQPLLQQQQQHKLTSIQISAETTVYTSLDSSLAALQRQQSREDEVDGANSNSLPSAVELLLSVSVPDVSTPGTAVEEGSEKVVLQPAESEKEERAETSRSDDPHNRSSAAVGVGAVALGSSSSSLLETVQEKPSPSSSPPPSPVVTDQESHVVRIQIVQKEDDSSSRSVVQNGTPAVISVTNSSATIVNGNQCKSKVSIVSFGPPEQGSKSPSPTPSVEMVQKQSSPSATPTNGKADLVDVNNATYLYYMMSSGQCSPSDTLDSGTCSDIEVTPPPLPKKMSPKSPSPCKHPAAQHATLMMISPTPSDKLNQPGYRSSSYTISDSDESESSLSCDSLNFSQLCGNVVVVGNQTLEPTDSISEAPTSPQTPEPSSAAAVSPTSDSDRENIPECPELITAKKHKIVSILPHSLLKDIRERSSSGCAAREVPSYSPPPSPPRDETVVLTTTRSILMEKINSLNSVVTNGDSVCSLSEKNKSFSFENDKFYKFHINEHSNLQSQPTQQQQQDHQGSNGLMNLNSCSSSVIDDDESFAGFKDLTSGTSTIRSNKGTVRGVKNRVRNGIATFLQMQHANIKSYKEKDAGKVVVYTTSMGIVRETYTKCANVKQILRTLLVKFEERDVFMSSDYQQEIKDRMQSEAIQVPQVFVDGQHVGDADWIERLNETGELRKMLKPYKCLESSFTCKTCGGYRLLPCPSCGGSKKSIHRNHFTAEFIALKCMNCDEVGLVKCHNC
ncbi:glutaredoxin domain-containing cysteine-rich protein CG12206-like [Ochlerotatus camptorhynchus]|uniref:glutaredoxin domain-containing cysteine-rich protein CG12206-like n=1 Tax=Ochlerotatus camptorhynchus TaxID=644619 RepID=UPI0031DAFF41